MGDRGEHQVGDRGPMLPAQRQRRHDVHQVLLGRRADLSAR
jgi:hypothetical protein